MAMPLKTRPQRVDSAEIITIVDNVIENSESKLHENVVPASQWVSGENTSPSYTFAGHGLATLIRAHLGKHSFEVLYDTGPSGEILLHNLRALGIDLCSINAIVLSHGHWDHFGGLKAALADINRNDVPIYLHPRMLSKRRVISKTESSERIHELPPVCSLDEIQEVGGIAKIMTKPTLIAGETILKTGEIPRVTEYEKGFPNHQSFVDGVWIDDSEIIDDNCLAIETQKGLIVVTGCAHAGIVNSVKEAIRLTGVDKVCAIVGGFHLVGRQNEQRIKKTIIDLKMFSPDMIVPCHCSGAIAQHMIANAFPEAYVTCSVGNMYKF
jgi:7,8-dihydropterin-6-yl-methyl-4-(beta-D-ribofuranosyl)aminobenzene 5'-phosphate synthase